VNNVDILMQANGTFLSIVIPCYNEADRIVVNLSEIFYFLTELKYEYEIIIVDDGSHDQIRDVLDSTFKNNTKLRYFSYKENRGKGYAVKFGVMQAKGSLVMFLDADGATPIGEFIKLYEAIEKGADVAIGSRAMDTALVKLEAKWHRILIGRIFNAFVNFLCVPGIKDTQCGFKLFTREAADLIFSRQSIDGFAFDCELLHIARKHGLTIREIPVNWKNVEGSKVNLLIDPLYMFLEIVRIRMRSLWGTYR
jgi:dolichyl-phosphate beta-glucosyltransferase